MIIRVKRNWVFLTGIKFIRQNLIIDSDKFVQFWALASGIFPNISLIVSTHKILVIFTIRGRNYEKLQYESVIFDKKLNNLVLSMLSGHTGLKLWKLKIEDFSFINGELINHQNLDIEYNLSFHSHRNEITPSVMNIKKVLPRAILQESGLYKIMIMFENLKFNSNLKNTFLAMIQFGTCLVIGSRQYGKHKSVLLEIVDEEYTEVNERYKKLISICNQSNQFSGKLSIVDPKLLEKNLLEYSLGLYADSHISHNFIEIITKLPDLLTVE